MCSDLIFSICNALAQFKNKNNLKMDTWGNLDHTSLQLCILSFIIDNHFYWFLMYPCSLLCNILNFSLSYRTGILNGSDITTKGVKIGFGK